MLIREEIVAIKRIGRNKARKLACEKKKSTPKLEVNLVSKNTTIKERYLVDEKSSRSGRCWEN